jgi:hypothetical protein
MNIALNDEDAKTLRDFLEEYLPELKFEAARTEAQPLRHVLYTRQTMVERLLDQLREVSTPRESSITSR